MKGLVDDSNDRFLGKLSSRLPTGREVQDTNEISQIHMKANAKEGNRRFFVPLPSSTSKKMKGKDPLMLIFVGLRKRNTMTISEVFLGDVVRKEDDGSLLDGESNALKKSICS
ncbi:unnamed protein product [Lactuca saligna]|uniref:Uncharacterized protein n=1 Tax=Lactuca saligna TaxID=75948 RepID=A0AA36EBQ1_LACSI|nr:unnamed protein product [Lactuca saligna]